MNPLDLAGHFASATIALGIFFLTKKSIWGWVFRFIGEVAWVVIGFLMGWSSVWAWGLVFLTLDAKGFYEWWKWEGRHDDQD